MKDITQTLRIFEMQNMKKKEENTKKEKRRADERRKQEEENRCLARRFCSPKFFCWFVCLFVLF